MPHRTELFSSEKHSRPRGISDFPSDQEPLGRIHLPYRPPTRRKLVNLGTLNNRSNFSATAYLQRNRSPWSIWVLFNVSNVVLKTEHRAHCLLEASRNIDESYIKVNMKRQKRREATHIRQKISDIEECHFNSKTKAARVGDKPFSSPPLRPPIA